MPVNPSGRVLLGQGEGREMAREASLPGTSLVHPGRLLGIGNKGKASALPSCADASLCNERLPCGHAVCAMG
jgi:hypothetical protein